VGATQGAVRPGSVQGEDTGGPL
jgi:hypothetical protein